MPYIMKPETWLKETSATMKPRSSALKAVDRALTEYHEAPGEPARKKLSLALHHWKMSKGYDSAAGKPAWMTSTRNSRGTVEALDLQVFGINKPLSPSFADDAGGVPFYGIESWAGDRLARDVLKEARRQALPLLFMGKKVRFKSVATAMSGKRLRKQLNKAKKSGDDAKAAAYQAAADPAKRAVLQAARPVTQDAERIAREIIAEVTQVFPTVAEQLLHFLEELVPNFMAELAGAVVPYASLVRTGSKAVTNTVKATVQQHHWIKVQEHRVAFGGGDPQAAARALKRMIERERNKRARLAAIYTTDVSVKSASIVADAAAFGAPTVSAVVTPLQGFATAVAVLSQEILLLARDIHEMQQANKALSIPELTQLSAGIFQTCPLLGCYFIASSNTSDIINFLVEDIGAPGWKLDVEVMVEKHIEPTIGYARGVILASRLEVEGLEMSKGAVADLNSGNAVSVQWRRRKAKVVGKIKHVLPFTENMQDYRTFAQHQGHTAVAPDILRSRIKGMGNPGN